MNSKDGITRSHHENPLSSITRTPAEDFEESYKEAYLSIDQGIVLITQGHKELAGSLLQKGLSLIDKVLSVKVEQISQNAEKVQQYLEMQNKMRCTRKEILNHFSDVQISGSATGSTPMQGVGGAPPSYEESLQCYNAEVSSRPGEFVTSLYPNLDPHNTEVQQAAFAEIYAESVTSPQPGEMIFQIENGVQIFFIYPNGEVTSPSYPSFLTIFTLNDPIGGITEPDAARGFLQVGEWTYPLVPSQSPVLHSFYGAYMFPDVTNNVPGASVGVLIPDTVDKETREFFEAILVQMTSYQTQPTPAGVDAEDERVKVVTTSSRIASGAEAVSKGIVWGAEKLNSLITYGSEKLKGSLEPEKEQRKVDPKLQTTARVAKNVSGKAVRISGFLLNQVGKATALLGRKLAPHIQHHGTKVVSRLTGQRQEDAGAKVDGVLEVASGAVKGAATIYMSLENAAQYLALSLTNNTVKVIDHKYGEEAGQFASDTMFAVGQTAMAGHNVASLGVKGMAKRTAKETGKALLEQHETKKQGGQQ